jgi:hypothetical protein
MDGQFEDDDIDTLCTKFKAVFLLWDGEFMVARTHHPDEVNIAQYCKLVTAAVHRHKNLMCSITLKVHYMWRHVEEQMRKIMEGLGDKMEHWVERGHQVVKRYCSRLCTMQDLTQRSKAGAKLVRCDNNPQVMAQVMSLQYASKRKFIVGKNEQVWKQRSFQMSVTRIEWKRQTNSQKMRHGLCLHYLPPLTLRQMTVYVRNDPLPTREDMPKLCLAMPQLLPSERIESQHSVTPFFWIFLDTQINQSCCSDWCMLLLMFHACSVAGVGIVSKQYSWFVCILFDEIFLVCA